MFKVTPHRLTGRPTTRRALTLLEVIFATAVAALMLVPMAGLIQATGKNVQHSADPPTASTFRDAATWIDRQTQQATDIQLPSSDRLRLQTTTGWIAITDANNRLMLYGKGTPVTLAENVQRVTFTPTTAVILGSTELVGISMQIVGTPTTGSPVTDVTYTIALPTSR